MACGYVVAQINLTDPQTYAGYIKLVLPTIQHFDGEFLIRGCKSISYEGELRGSRMVVIGFPCYQAAQDCYHSDEYAGAKAIRMSASTSVQTIIERV